jgi:hypothetical protein
MVDGLLQRTDDDAVIGENTKYHILLKIKAGINLGWGEASIDQTLLQLFKPINTCLLQTIHTLPQFKNIGPCLVRFI